MNLHMDEDSTQVFTEVPLYLPRLFVSPSFLHVFAKALEDHDVARKKIKLLNETLKLQEAMHVKDQERMEHLRSVCTSLWLKIESLESEAYEMRKELVKRIYVVVTSEKEMKAAVHLWRGTGAGVTPGMRCFRGKVYVPMNPQKQWRTQDLFYKVHSLNICSESGHSSFVKNRNWITINKAKEKKNYATLRSAPAKKDMMKVIIMRIGS